MVAGVCDEAPLANESLFPAREGGLQAGRRSLMVAVRRPTSSFGRPTGRHLERSPAPIPRAEMTTASTGESAARARKYAPPP